MADQTTPHHRDLPFFVLLEAFREPGCALCRLTAAATNRYLEHLLYAHVNDAGFRQRWRTSRGFCAHHAWLLARSADALGLAILYLDLVRNHGQALLTHPAPQPCPLCQAERRTLQHHLEALVRHWQEPELRRAVDDSDGLCGPHLRAAMHLVPNEDVAEVLREVSVASLKHLERDLQTLIEAFDYRQPMPEDERIKLAWRRATAKIVGACDVRIPACPAGADVSLTGRILEAFRSRKQTGSSPASARAGRRVARPRDRSGTDENTP